ncbi:PAS domain-containing protein [Candidatus Sumerlaeota bacterium]|nr:PAS domain-containing protein [Candidatus Sumerlaeota bacterium]
MTRRTFFGQIFPAFLAITLLAVVGVTWHATSTLERFYHKRTREELAARADLAQARFMGALRSNDDRRVDMVCNQIASETPMRLTVVLPSGRVVGDSEEDPARMDNHADRPEIVEALREGRGSSVRFSDTLQRDMMYVTKAIRDNDKTLGVLRVSMSLAFIDQELGTIHRRVTLVALLATALVALSSVWVSRPISRSLARLKTGAERFARGELGIPLAVPDSLEIGALAESMNRMAAELDDRIQTTVRQRNELEAVLAGMVEGVLAVDGEENILNLNQAAARLLDVDAAQSRRKPLQEVVRNVEIHELVRRVMDSGEPGETETVFQGDRDAVIRVRVAPLRDAKKESAGVLAVMNDLTDLRHLEKVRRDFVANVSHELKTPITSIKGYVETLLDGASHNAEDLDRFLKIIHRQVDRLHAIVDDLLALSQIEEDDRKGQVLLGRGALLPVIEGAVGLCKAAALEKDTAIHVSCSPDIQADIDPHLLGQACVNLIDNAVKYGEPGSEIHVEVATDNGEIVIHVRDQGPGVAQEHLARVFERFYRVDKARSRELGGTGLGLAIVKHIAQAHGGRATVESELRKGSVFSIRLPLPPEQM